MPAILAAVSSMTALSAGLRRQFREAHDDADASTTLIAWEPIIAVIDGRQRA